MNVYVQENVVCRSIIAVLCMKISFELARTRAYRGLIDTDNVITHAQKDIHSNNVARDNTTFEQ